MMGAPGGDPMAQGGDPTMGGGDPMAQGGQDPTAELQGMLSQYAQTQDPQLAVAICDTLVQAMGLEGGGPMGGQDPMMGGGPPPMPGMEDPAMAQGGAPMGQNGMQMPYYRGGGKVRFVKRAK